MPLNFAKIIRPGFFLAVLSVVVMLVGCKESPLTVRELYRKTASGVVLVSNKYYYFMNVGGTTLYFTGKASDGSLVNLTDNPDSATARANTIYGTGFFINQDGSILTNRHIVRPETDVETARESVGAAFTQIEAFLRSAAECKAAQYEAACSAVRAATGGSATMQLDAGRMSTMSLELEKLRGSYDAYAKALASLENVRRGKIIVNCAGNVRVAFHKVDTTKAGAFKECNVTKVSGLDDTDLAVIQLKNRKTPRNRYVFHFLAKNHGMHTMLETFALNLRSDNEGRRLRAGTRLCMVGYDGQPSGLNGEPEVLARSSSGEILEDPGQDKVMYSLPLNDMSSGSPVMNMYGDVVCVNFAETVGDNTFGFGIPLHKIKGFLGIN